MARRRKRNQQQARRWVTEEGASPDGDHRLRVLTWNVLAERARLNVGSGTDSRRVRPALDFIGVHRADIVLLQELQQRPKGSSVASKAGDHAAMFYDGMRTLGYEGLLGKTGAPLTTGVFWRPDSVVCRRARSLLFPHVSHKNAVVLSCTHRKSGLAVVVCGLHLSVPVGPQGQFDGQRQSLELEGCLRAVGEQVGPEGSGSRQAGPGVIVAGDFNSLPASALCESLAARGLASAYARVLGAEPPCTTVNSDQGFVGTVDYVWFGGPGLRARRVLGLPGRRPEVLPDGDTPSDHFPLLVDFEVGGDSGEARPDLPRSRARGEPAGGGAGAAHKAGAKKQSKKRRREGGGERDH